ncbi:AAA family ATPase [Uliginosibacterium sediminicola]|uniref:AAA family ATPase n=1 Tax=Uliginosibacterium sediminicola TaxID=2024550 RepID=A0ABU9YU01_9RHOO
MSTKTRSTPPTGSDVLAKAAAKAEISADDLRAIRIWLADQLVAQEYAKLGQGGHTNTQVPLRQVFVDLPIASNASASMQREDRTLFLSSMLAAGPLDLRNTFKARSDLGAASHAKKEKEEDEEKNAELFDSAIEHEHLRSRWGATLLIGGPGQGKSTLGQLACQLHRAALIHPAANELTTVQRELVNSFIPSVKESKSKKDANKLGLPNGPLLPLQVTLPDFAAWAASSTLTKMPGHTPSLLQFLADLPSAREVGLDAAKLFSLVCVLPSLLVLDGFDEVGATQDRMRIVVAARELLTALSERSASSQILATTRPQGYADELSQVGVKFQKVFLAPLTRDEALEYAKKLIQAKISGADQQAKALRQIHEAAAEPATERLLTTPLQVTILTALVQQLGRAPRERWNLFSRYFAYTFDREIERGTYASALLAEHRSHIERIHARVALLLQVEAERDGGAAARMTKARLEEVISEVLAEDEVAKEQRNELVHEIASAAENRLVFLVEPEPGKFGFEIRSLQEFMAAWALTAGRDSEIEARLYQVSKAPMFRNVALFISSRLFSEGSPLRDTLADRICGSLDEDKSDELSRASRAGSLLALETLEEGAALSQPKRARALMAKAVGLLALPPGQEHIRLVRAANEDTYPVLRLAIDRGLGSSTPDASFCRASAWACIVDATNRNETWAIELGGRYWSPDSASQTLFEALARSHVPLGEWISRSLESIAHEVRPDIFLDAQPQRVDRNTPSTWTSWLTSAYGSHASWRHRNRIGFIPIANSRALISDSTPPDYGIPVSDSWRAWIAAAKFDCTPTAANLITAVEELAKCPMDYWTRLKWQASWPLAACISCADEPADFLKQADMIRSGLLGDEKDWAKAERQWKDRLDIVSVLGVVEEAVPWTLESIAVGPPLFAVAGWFLIGHFGPRSKKAQPVEVLHRANELYLKSQSSALRQRLAEICLVIWRGLPIKANRVGLNPKSWVESAPGAASLLVPRPKAMTAQEWKSLLDLCDAKSSHLWLLDAEGIFSSLLLIPNHPVLLKLAAHTVGIYADHYRFQEGALLEKAREAVSEVDVTVAMTPAARGDIAILRCFAGSHPSSQDSELLADVLAASESDPNIWSNLLGALKISSLPRSRINSLLSEIYATLGASHTEAHYAIKEIRDALQKRTSDLDSRTTWDKLALPLPYPSLPLQAKLEGGIPTNPVRISRLEVQDIGGIEKLALDLTPPSEGTGQWIVIIGPNGSGKTTLLRSLALALRSVKHPSIWPKGAFSGSWQRIPAKGQESVLSSQIVVSLGDGVEHRTLIRPNTSISITQLPEQDRPRLFPIFAYGCRRGSALGGTARQVNLNDDDGPEIATLFDEGADLIQAETWLIALEGDTTKNTKSKTIFENVISAMKKLMNLESIEVYNQRVIVSESGGAKIPFGCLSDGYLTNAGWFLDLVARWITLAERNELEIGENFLAEMRGLVLIDEIDLHLHPRWQIEIISRTKALLPKMSFVVTTHNPLTLVGAKAEEVWILDRSSGTVSATAGIDTPMLLTGGQIYQKYFGISEIFPNQFGRLLQRFGYLSGYAMRSDAEEAELEDVRRTLAAAGIDPGWDVVPRYQDELPPNRPAARRKGKREGSGGGT